MTSLMQPLRDEHAGLRPRIERLRDVADAVGVVPLVDLRADVHAAHDFLEHELVPHAAAEDRVLYPVVDELVGSDGATMAMRFEHAEIRRLTGELGALVGQLDTVDALGGDLAASLRRVLYGLHVVLCMHLAAEEHYVVPVLELGLTSPEAAQLLGAMHVAVAGDAALASA